jgi:flavin reductase (DIM6/NTAB) family NADH-FMN oxidoreductase RutF
MEGQELYQLLRHLTSPIVAVTTTAAGRTNGMIANSAQRASLVLSVPRVSLYVSKTNFSHDLIYASGVLGMHLLRSDQWDVVRILGTQSGRDMDKLAMLETRSGETGCPMLVDAFAALECRVVNAMDTGASTFFLADVVSAQATAAGEVMTSDSFRANVPEALRRLYEEGLTEAQARLEPLARAVARSVTWPGPTTPP